MKSRFFIILALSALGASSAWGAPLSTPAEVQNALVGNTISGEEHGQVYMEYLAPDGQILGEGAQGRYKGKWRIDGPRICFQYDDQMVDFWDCVGVDVQDNKITWIDEDNEKTDSKLTPGKPNGW